MSFPYSKDSYEVVTEARTRVTRRTADGMLFVEVWLPQVSAGWYPYIGPVKLKEYMHTECLGVDLDPAPLPAGVVPAESSEHPAEAQ